MPRYHREANLQILAGSCLLSVGMGGRVPGLALQLWLPGRLPPVSHDLQHPLPSLLLPLTTVPGSLLVKKKALFLQRPYSKTVPTSILAAHKRQGHRTQAFMHTAAKAAKFFPEPSHCLDRDGALSEKGQGCSVSHTWQHLYSPLCGLSGPWS